MNPLIIAPLFLAILSANDSCSLSIEQLWALSETLTVSFTETERIGDRVRVARFDGMALESHRWRLLSVNDAPPDSDQVDDFLESKLKNGNDISFQEMIEGIDRSSIEQVNVAEGETVYRFRPLPESEDEKAFIDDLDGELIVRSDERCEILMKRFNTAPISPAIGVRLEQFSITTRLRPISPDGRVFPIEFSAHVKGRAFVFKKFEQTTVVKLSEVTLHH